MIRIALAAALLGSTILVTACNQAADTPVATDTAKSVIAVTEPWSRETAEGQNAGGAFMTIANTGTAADWLTGHNSSMAAFGGTSHSIRWSPMTGFGPGAVLAQIGPLMAALSRL